MEPQPRHAAVCLVAEAASQAHAAGVGGAARLELLHKVDGRRVALLGGGLHVGFADLYVLGVASQVDIESKF